MMTGAVATAVMCCSVAVLLLAAGGGAVITTPLHLPADTPTGAIVRQLVSQAGISILPSLHSENFAVVGKGGLMVARGLSCLAGTNTTLALTLPATAQTQLLSVHVHSPEAALRWERAHFVFSVVENQPAGVVVGALVLAGEHHGNLHLALHPAALRSKLAARPSYSNLSTVVRLVTLTPLDREAAAKLGGKLVATNSATGETATTGIEVIVENVNDNTPEFSRKIYSLTGDRTAPRYSVVGRVEAKDKDGDSVVYSLARPATGPFIVVPQTGELLLTQQPQLAMYLLQVGAKDRGVPARSAKPALVYLSFPPAAQQGEEANRTVEAHSRVKRRVTRAVRPTKRTEFTEADGEPEGKIVFQLEKESEHETFKIRDENPWVTVEPNGAVRVKKKWDYEELGREKTIDFWVIITNSGSGGKPRIDMFFYRNYI